MKDQLRLENQICHPLYSASNALVRAYRPLLQEIDLTYPQYLVMMALWERDEVAVKHLVEVTFLDAGTLTPILKRLEQKKYLIRKKSAEDERHKQICLTAAGRSLEEKAAEIPERLSCKIGMNLEEAQLLKSLTSKLLSSLQSDKL